MVNSANTAYCSRTIFAVFVTDQLMQQENKIRLYVQVNSFYSTCKFDKKLDEKIEQLVFENVLEKRQQ